MKKIITVIALALLCMRAFVADAQDGLHNYSAYDAGTFGCGSGSFTDVQNTNFAAESYENAYNVIWHKFTLMQTANVNISLCGSGWDTYLYLVDQYGNDVDFNDDNYGVCGSASSAISETGLSAGTYYIATGGYGSNTGNVYLELDVTGTGSASPGAGTANAIFAGSFTSSGGSYTDTRSNADPCLGNYIGQPSNDIFYQFTLSGTATVTIATCGSSIDTYLHLLNGSSGEIAFDDDGGCGNFSSAITATLSAGTYYVVSEGYGTNQGSITTTITVGAGLQAPCISYGGGPKTFNVGTVITPWVPVNSCGAVSAGATSTFVSGYYQPLGTVIDPSGNLYVSDAGWNQIFKVSPGGVSTLFVGSGSAALVNGSGSGASFYHPVGMASDASGNIYVADQDNNVIRRIDPAGNVTTYAGTGSQGSTNGFRTSATFYLPCGVAVDASGNVYVADSFNNMIRKIDPAGNVTTLAGTGVSGWQDGSGNIARFSQPFNLVADASGNLFVTDRVGQRIRKVTPAGVVSTVAGSGSAAYVNGNGILASFNGPTGIAIDQQNNLYVSDESNYMVRKIDPAGNVTTLAGSGATGSANGAANTATFNYMFGVAVNKNTGSLYMGELANQDVRKIIYAPYTITPDLPAGLTLDGATGTISGTPTVTTSATNYTVTAANSAGSGSTTVNIAISGFAGCAIATLPSADRNYIATYIPRTEYSSEAAVTSACPSNVMQTIQYLDGLGRPLQTVQVRGNPDATKDIVQPIVYDQFGRESSKYLPYTTLSGTVGGYKPDALTPGNGVYSFYDPTGTGVSGTQQSNSSGMVTIPIPSATTIFEASPLNRPVEAGAPGADWQPGAHTAKIEYASNDATAVNTGTGYWARNYQVSYSFGTAALTDNGAYDPNELYVTVSKDENWQNGQPYPKNHTVEEYKNKEDQVVLKRTFNDSDILSTYYVYDDFGNLSFVLPPKAEADGGGPTTLNTLCYQYHYDNRNRLVEKMVPGKGWEYMVYNTTDQIVAIQDANMRVINQWLITKYDALGRVAMTGIWNNENAAKSRPDMQTAVNSQSINWENRDNGQTYGYTLSSTYPGTLNKILTVNYYDDYNIPNLPTTYDQHTLYSSMTKGLSTATLTNVLNESDLLWTVIYYDDKGHTTHAYAQHYKGGTINTGNYDHIANTYDFTNVVTNTTRTHYTATAGSTPVVTVSNTYVYDHVGRKTKTWSRINSLTDSILVSKVEYSEVGQPKDKYLHSADQGTSFLQDVSYTYNERGWNNHIHSSLFDELLRYNSQAHGAAVQYNGNIAEQEYTGAYTGGQWVSYGYDALNRLTNANSSAGLSETGISYDKMGNILSLTRAGNTLSYAYNGNQLTTLSGALSGPQYYDANGNLEFDYRSDRPSGFLDFDHNILNLVSAVGGGQDMIYDYTATGEKIAMYDNSAGQTIEYMKGIEYTNGQLTAIATEEGRAVPNGGTYHYEYSLKDHLGNDRVRFDSNSGNNGNIREIQEDDYYAFGLNVNRYNFGIKDKHLYNNKELQEQLGQYDYGARFYDPVIARWTSVDPLAEKSRRWSPYNFAENNPVRFIDPDGMETQDPQKKVNTTVTSVEDEHHHLQVTQSTTTTTVVPTKNGGSITTKTTTSATDDISNSETQATTHGDVTTRTSVTTVDGHKTTTVFGDATTVSRVDSKSDLSALNSVDKSLESFRNDNHDQFNDALDKKGNFALSVSLTGGALPFALAANKLVTDLVLRYVPGLARASDAVGGPVSIGGVTAVGGSAAIDAAHPIGSPKIILVTSNGQTVSDLRPQKYK